MEVTDESLPLLQPSEWIEAVESTDQGEPLPTPFAPWIPNYTKGRCTVVGADTEVGKTAFGLQSFKEVIDGGYRACYLTTEMTPADLFQRFHPQFESPEECKDWIKEKGAIVSQPGIDAHEIVQILRQGFDFVVLDHIHDVPFEGHEDLARKVKRIASLAPYMNTSILMLSQIKQPDPISPSPPSKHDFSWTKAIGEVAAVAFVLHKEDEGIVELHNVKNRFGSKSLPLSLRLDPFTVTFKRA
jgi:hypothetical protein